MLDKIEAHRFMYRFIKNQIQIYEFEQWLYSHDELEDLLGDKEYFDFVSRDYKNKYAFQDTEKQIRNLISLGFFEQERILDLLNKLIQNDNEPLRIMERLYDDYCDGYNFLRYIALYFISTSDEYLEVLKNDQIRLQQYLAPIKVDAKRLLAYFEKDELSIVVENVYTDKRDVVDRIELHSINEMLAKKKEP
ncbi:hypothetical protein [Paenibacillus prosopidis]|uniref:Uncharacterized protein n=1 Tax=Paenibacillus prosopidis TaxID=630520 RepID=A0A368VH22_9BACL|nr:hypothetical protein [Paenibacillus prosopidis]RCW40629.1 hypothetical protein DFP97_1308 [Paenibacillus prosopidis]